MDFTIISLGNVEFLTMVLNGVAMICGTGDFARLVAVGFVIGLLFIGFQCIFEGGQRINLHHSLLCFLCYLCMFGPSCTVVVEDAYTGHVRTVDNLPLGVGVAGAAISGIGYGVTQMLEQGYSTFDRTTEHQFAEPLRILNKVRDIGQSELVFSAINRELGPRANGAPSDSKQALINYLSECTMAKIQLNATTPTALYHAPWGDEFKFTSEAHTVMLPIGGMDGKETVSCNKGYEKLNSIFQKISSTAVKTAINQHLHLKDENGQAISGNYDKLDSAMQGLNATMNGSQDYIQMVLIEGVYGQAALKFHGSQQDMASAIAVNQAMVQRNTQWASEGTMSLSASRALMAFFEGFVYAITPIMGFLIAIGSFGVRLVGKYFLTIAWIQLWLPILSILNLYVMTGARSAITDANLGAGASFYALDTLWSETATWMSTGGMLTAATPMLALFLVSGSTFAFTALTGRLGGQDHFNEKIQSPDAVQPSAVMSHASHWSSDRMHGLRATGSDPSMAKVNVGTAMAANVSSKQGLVNSSLDNLTAQINEATTSGLSTTGAEQLQQTVGRNLASMRVDGNQTAMQAMNNSGYFAGKTATEKQEALGALSAALTSGVGLETGAEYGKFTENGKEVIKGGVIGHAAAALGIHFKVGADGGVKVTGTATSTDSHSDANTQTAQFGNQDSTVRAQQLAANLSKGYQATLNNMTTEQWAEMASQNKSTAVGMAFGKVATATKELQQAISASKTFGGQQSVDVGTLSEQLRGTEAGKYLANFERTAEGRNAHLAATTKKYSDLFGGDLEKGKIAAALDYITNNVSDTAMQAKLGDALADSKLPMMGISPVDAQAYGNDLRKPGDAEMFVKPGQSYINDQEQTLKGAKPSSVSFEGERSKIEADYKENSGKDLQKGTVVEQGAINKQAVMSEPQKEALHDLDRTSHTSAMAQFANDWLRDGVVDSLAKHIRDHTPAPTEGDAKQTGMQWMQAHQQTIRDLTSAQKNYVEAYHEVRGSTDEQLVQTGARLDQAFAGVRDEIRQTLYGNTKDEDLTKEQHQAIAHYTISMAQRLNDVHDFDNQAEANTVTRFNTAFDLKRNP